MVRGEFRGVCSNGLCLDGRKWALSGWGGYSEACSEGVGGE